MFFSGNLRLYSAHTGWKDMIQDIWKNRDAHGIKHLKDVVEHLMGASTHIRDIIENELASFRIYIVLNQVRSGREIMIGASVKSVCLKFLGFDAQYAGHIEYDETVLRCINKRPFYAYASVFTCGKRDKQAYGKPERRQADNSNGR